jgi:hypothetical protein
MTDKQKQEILANDWLAYIKASLAMANTSKDKYEIVPYKNWKGIKKYNKCSYSYSSHYLLVH